MSDGKPAKGINEVVDEPFVPSFRDPLGGKDRRLPIGPGFHQFQQIISLFRAGGYKKEFVWSLDIFDLLVI